MLAWESLATCWFGKLFSDSVASHEACCLPEAVLWLLSAGEGREVAPGERKSRCPVAQALRMRISQKWGSYFTRHLITQLGSQRTDEMDAPRSCEEGPGQESWGSWEAGEGHDPSISVPTCTPAPDRGSEAGQVHIAPPLLQ